MNLDAFHSAYCGSVLVQRPLTSIAALRLTNKSAIQIGRYEMRMRLVSARENDLTMTGFATP
jgi:hypothetical protein